MKPEEWSLDFLRAQVSRRRPSARTSTVSGLVNKGYRQTRTSLATRSNRILSLAAEEANRLLHPDIDTEHLLLGILREDQSVAASILATYGMRINEVRDEIVVVHSETTCRTAP